MSAKAKPAISADRRAAQKAAAKKRPQTWKPGQSGNPAGGPKRGESWAEIIKRVGEYTPSQAAARSLELAKRLLDIGDGVTLKEATVLRVYAALLFDPDARLFGQIMDRAEGKITQAVELSWKDEARKHGIDPDALVGEFVAAMGAGGGGGGSLGSSEDQETG